jgi:hypothetical protein
MDPLEVLGAHRGPWQPEIGDGIMAKKHNVSTHYHQGQGAEMHGYLI